MNEERSVRADSSLLKAARVKLGLKQEEIARAAGLSEHAVMNLEKGHTEPRDGTWEKYQRALEARGIVFTNGDKPGFYFDKSKVIIPV
jgi:DNA-binding XRE family transcriptional regulator